MNINQRLMNGDFMDDSVLLKTFESQVAFRLKPDQYDEALKIFNQHYENNTKNLEDATWLSSTVFNCPVVLGLYSNGQVKIEDFLNHTNKTNWAVVATNLNKIANYYFDLSMDFRIEDLDKETQYSEILDDYSPLFNHQINSNAISSN